MPTRKDVKKGPDRPVSKGDFIIEGKAQLEAIEELPRDVSLRAYAFDAVGQLLGMAELDAKGNFSFPVNLAGPADVELIIGPADDPQAVRKSSAYSKRFSAKDWTGEGRRFRLKPDLFLARDIWQLLLPIRVCVSGHVRKIHLRDGTTEICPVPFVKVEIFDVDRESCWWPYISRWWDRLLDRPVIRIPELLKVRPVPPRPLPGPGPVEQIGPPARLLSDIKQLVMLNPQPEPPRPVEHADLLEMVSLSPQPEPPSTSEIEKLGQLQQAAFSRVGEVKTLAPSLASRLETLTLSSRVEPWLIFPFCFYSRQLVCETTTDNCGYFRCCFRWWPFHFRRGRLRFDARPDIIIKVTQVINGVETVIYLDPYTSTRWNVTNAHIDVYVDDEDVQCGSCDETTRPAGTQVFFTRIGNDEVYWINQTAGLYSKAPLSNMAYGGQLRIYGQFGDTLSNAAPIAGATPPYYYRLSYRKGAAGFTAITADLADTRVNKVTLFSETHALGPQTINGVPALYEVRDFANYYWYNPDWIGMWYTPPVEDDTGLYTLRLEVFDANGVKLTSALIDYRDGTVMPPAVLPSMTDRCDLIIRVDNKPAVVDLQIPGVLNECGVIPWSPMLTLNFSVSVAQENNRLYSWGLQYTKGVNPAVHVLSSPPNYLPATTSNSGSLSPVNTTVSGAPLLVGLSTTCAFALKLYAWAHIRNGYGFIYYTEQIKAIAIEKC
jgi:hypothetical protein